MYPRLNVWYMSDNKVGTIYTADLHLHLRLTCWLIKRDTCIKCTMLTELITKSRYMYILHVAYTTVLYLLQNKDTPLHLAAYRGHTTCVEHLLSTPGIDVSSMNEPVSWSLESYAV